MMGTKEVRRIVGSGTFFCRVCGSDQPYWQKIKWRKFYFYYMGLISYGKKVEFVECRNCTWDFNPEVLALDWDNPDNSFRSDSFLILRTMVLMLLADDVAGEDEIEAVMEIFREVTGHTLSREAVLADIADARASGKSLNDYLPALAAVLTEERKLLLIEVLFLVALADWELHDSELETLNTVAEGLNISPDDMALHLEILQIKYLPED